MKLAAVVLAAGASSRMGRPKARLIWRGQAFVQHCIERARGVGADPIIVVTGAVDLAEVTVGTTVVHNAAWQDGPLGSLQCGLRAVPQEASVLVLTVDRPHVAPATVQTLIDSASSEPDGIWQPRHGDQRGHPIVHPPDIARQLLQLGPHDTPRTVLRHPDVQGRRRSVEVDDPAVLDNIDHPHDLGRLPV